MKLFKILFLFSIANLSLSSDDDKECNKDLMKLFKLEGRQKPRYNNYVDICGKKMDTCCSVYDQTLIIKYWNEYSKTHINHFTSGMSSLYKAFISFHPIFEFMSPQTLSFADSLEFNFPYIRKICLKKSHDSQQDSYLPDMVTDDFKIYNFDEQIDEQPINKHYLEKEVQKVFKTKKRERKLSLIDQPNLESRIEISDKQMIALKNMDLVKSKFQTTLKNVMRRLQNTYQQYTPEDKKMQSEIEQKITELNYLFSKSKKNKNIFKEMAQKQDNLKTNKDQIFSGTIYEDKTDPEMLKNKYIEERIQYERLMQKYKKYNKQRKAYIQQFLKNPSLFDLNKLSKKQKSNFIPRLLTKINKKLIPALQMYEQKKQQKNNRKLEKYNLREFPNMTKISAPNYECEYDFAISQRLFYVANMQKYKFCYLTHQKIVNFPIDDFRKYMPNIQNTLLALNDVKKGLYCAVCDYNFQKFINMEEKQIYLSQHFCKSLVVNFEAYFKWKSLFLIDYLSSILEYIHCQQTDNNDMNFPFKTILHKQKLQQYFINDCLEHKYDDYLFFKKCFFVCSNFTFNKMHDVIEGDIKLMRKVYFRIAAFLRQKNMTVPHENSIEYVREELHLFQQQVHHKEEVQIDIQKMFQKEQKYLKNFGRVLEEEEDEEEQEEEEKSEEMEATQAVYDIEIPPPSLNDFETIYLEQAGINPIQLSNNMNLDHKIDEYIEIHKKRHQEEAISNRVLKRIFINKDQIQSFNNNSLPLEDDQRFTKVEKDETVETSQQYKKVMSLYNNQKKKDKKAESYSAPPKIYEEMKTIGQKENMPEMDLILN